MSLNITRMLELSTSHLTADTARLLSEPRDSLMVGDMNEGWAAFAPIYYPKGECGFFVHVSTDESLYPYLPVELVSCMQFAIRQDCAWLMFDRDADPIEGLEIHEW